MFSALASGRSASWAKLVIGETRGFLRRHTATVLENMFKMTLHTDQATVTFYNLSLLYFN